LDGLNQQWSTNDYADYIFPQHGFYGTSAAAPLVSGIIALMLSANSTLSYRDVQQILILSAKQCDLSDPLMQTNGAGFRVSPNTGFGIPDAGLAVRMAREWKSRPKAVLIEYKDTNVYAIPDAGLSLQLFGSNLPNGLSSLQFELSEGPFPQTILPPLPLIHMGQLTEPWPARIDQKVALIQRGSNYFSEKIEYAWQAGAAWVVVYNNEGYTALMPMGGTERTHVPAAFIGQIDGESLRDLLSKGSQISAQFQRKSVVYHFNVTNTLLLEHVGLNIAYEHSRRSDVRITVQSPAGMLSVMQPNTGDDSPAPASWTYYSTHHFFEPSKGKWTVEICDTELNQTGRVNQVSLLLHGVPIKDSDGDGLDDGWEHQYFSSLTYGPKDDPDSDGLSNAREQVLQTPPMHNQIVNRLDITPWNNQLLRVSWPSAGGNRYAIDVSTNLDKPFTLFESVIAQDQESECLIRIQQHRNAFLRSRLMAE